MIPVIPLILAIVSPIIWGFMNVLDKYVVSKKVKRALSFTIVTGVVNLIFGLILILFLKWNFQLKDYIYPAIAGMLLGSQFFSYYIILKKEDASNLIGIIYLYPVFVALLSYLFLNEKLSLPSYLGMFIILIGVALLSVRMRKIKLVVSFWLIFVMILVCALYEFFIKVATNNLPAINGMAINSTFTGLVVIIPLMLHKKTRQGLAYELRNFKWALLSESLTFLGVITTYLAMAGLPATIVSSVAALQPLSVIIFERAADKYLGKMIRDHLLLPKLIPILLIILGVFLLYLTEIMALLKNP